jgi:dienelactone hydrolase
MFAMKFVSALVLACMALANPVFAQDVTIEQGKLPVTIHGSKYELDHIVVKRKDATGRLPIAFLTHGVSRTAQENLDVTTARLQNQAIDMALRGYLAVGIIRRGFGQSSAHNRPRGCGTGSFLPNLRDQAADLEGARRAIVERPDADPTRIVGLGVSVGGITMLAWANERPEGLIAIVNVSGGTGSIAANTNCDEPALVAAARSFGDARNAPSIWFYAANDTYFGPAAVQRMYEGFTARGGMAELHAFDAIGTDGHGIWSISDGRQRWLPEMDKFLRARGLPVWDPAPAAKIAANLNESGKRTLERYLAAPAHKVLMLSTGKGTAYTWRGANDLDTARKNGLESCEKSAGEKCRVVMENFVATP